MKKEGKQYEIWALALLALANLAWFIFFFNLIGISEQNESPLTIQENKLKQEVCEEKYGEGIIVIECPKDNKHDIMYWEVGLFLKCLELDFGDKEIDKLYYDGKICFINGDKRLGNCETKLVCYFK